MQLRDVPGPSILAAAGSRWWAPKAEPSNSINLLRFFLNRLIAISTLCLPAGGAFFSCPKKRNKRKGSPVAETTPFAKVRNRRGNNSLRSNSLPLHPVPHLAARLSANGPPSCPNTPQQNKPQADGATVRGAGKLKRGNPLLVPMRRTIKKDSYWRV